VFTVILRSWIAFTAVVAIVQGILALLLILQHDAIYSELLRQRVSVVAQTTAAAFQPIVDLGLPISMIRSGDMIVARALETDPEIRSVHAINPSGIIVFTTEQRPATIGSEVLRAMRLSKDIRWSAETTDDIHSAFNIVRRDGTTVGAVVISYPKDRLNVASQSLVRSTARTALLIWAAASGVAFLLLHLLLAAQQRSIAHLDALAAEQAAEATDSGREALFDPEVERLAENMRAAGTRFEECRRALAVVASAADRNVGAGPASADPVQVGAAPYTQAITTDPSRSLAGQIAARLAPAAAVLIIASALIVGAVVLSRVNDSIEPELAARTNLIGTVVSENVQRALDTGVPLDSLVGAESYFGDMLHLLPEVAYVAVATGRIVLEAGARIDPYLAPPRERKEVRSHPILHNGEEVAYVIIDIDPRFIAKRFRDVFLDVGVVILVTVQLAYEIMLLLTSRSLTAPLDRLQRLAAMQAAGNFSSRVVSGARGVINRATRMLVDRAELLHQQFAAQWASHSERQRAALSRLRDTYGLSEGRPRILRVAYFTDIRLALFVFSAADELPLAFLPLYTRAAHNAWPWLDETVLISLPLAGYLLAILLASPYSRAVVERIGVQKLFVLAALPNVVAHLGLYFAETAQEIIFWRTVTGFGYALVTLAAQDYVLDVTPREHRDRTLGMFTLVLFGGAFAGISLGGVLADRLGQANVFLLSAGLVATSVALSGRLIGPGVHGTGGGGERPRMGEMLQTLMDRRFAALIFGLVVPAGVVLQAFLSYLAALTLDSLGASTADIGRILMIFVLAVCAVGPLGGRLSQAGIPPNLTALAGASLAGASLTLVSVAPSVLAITVAMLGSGIGQGLVRGAQTSLAMTMSETELARFGPATVLGAVRTFDRLGSIVGLTLIASIAGIGGYATAIGAIAVWSLAGAGFFVLAFPPRPIARMRVAE
jgi:MFS family permease